MNFSFAAALRPSFAAAAVVALLAAKPAQAQQAAAPVQLTQVDASSFRVLVPNAAQQAGQVQVVQLSNGQELFGERYAAGYGHRFNFRALPTGSYAISVQLGADHYRYTVQVRNTAQGAFSVSSQAEGTPGKMVATR